VGIRGRTVVLVVLVVQQEDLVRDDSPLHAYVDEEDAVG
jgi:hypothetical protein